MPRTRKTHTPAATPTADAPNESQKPNGQLAGTLMRGLKRALAA